MTHGRKPRKPRPVRHDALRLVKLQATKLTEAEVQETIEPARMCAERLREGVATEEQHTVLYTSLQIAIAIEHSGIVRGLHEHLDAARQAMDAVRTRALASGAWRPTALYHHELAAIRDAVEFHEFQLRQVSAGELTAIATKLIARTRSTGGKVARTTAQNLGLVAA